MYSIIQFIRNRKGIEALQLSYDISTDKADTEEVFPLLTLPVSDADEEVIDTTSGLKSTSTLKQAEILRDTRLKYFGM